MNISSVSISVDDPLFRSGTITLSEEYHFEVSGPFGTGYNIQVGRDGASGLLEYVRDGSCSAKTRRGTLRRSYQMSDTIVSSRKEGELTRIDESGNVQLLEDEVVMALLILNHFYWNRTGSFAAATSTTEVRDSGGRAW